MHRNFAVCTIFAMKSLNQVGTRLAELIVFKFDDDDKEIIEERFMRGVVHVIRHCCRSGAGGG